MRKHMVMILTEKPSREQTRMIFTSGLSTCLWMELSSGL